MCGKCWEIPDCHSLRISAIRALLKRISTIIFSWSPYGLTDGTWNQLALEAFNFARQNSYIEIEWGNHLLEYLLIVVIWYHNLCFNHYRMLAKVLLLACLLYCEIRGRFIVSYERGQIMDKYLLFIATIWRLSELVRAWSDWWLSNSVANLL